MKFIKRLIRSLVKDVLKQELKSILTDTSYRLDTLSRDGEKIGSHRLNLPGHILDGYVIEDNDPSPGHVSWSDCNIVYKGQNYTVQDSSTDKKYLFWLKDQPGQFQATDTKPLLGRDDVLILINQDGIAHIVISTGKFQHAGALVSESISNQEIAPGAQISTSKLKGAARDIENSGLGLASSADSLDGIAAGQTNLHFTQTKDTKLSGIQEGATKAEVTANKLRIGGSLQTLTADDTDKVAGTAATTIKDGAAAGQAAKGVTDAIYDGNSIIEGKIPPLPTTKVSGLDTQLTSLGQKTANLNAQGQISNVSAIGLGALATKSKIAEEDLNDNAVTSGKIANGSVGTAKIASGAVSNDKIASGAVEASKLNVSQHMIF